jgi:predicted DNA-binding transcriptional regulator AlpA
MLEDVFISVAGVAERFGVSTKTVWSWLSSDPTFPKPFKLSERCTRWKKSEIDRWETSKRAIQ